MIDLVKNLIVVSNNSEKIKKDELMLTISKYYKPNKSINVTEYDELKKSNDIEYYLTAKNKNDKFFIYYVESIVKSKYEKFIKDKLNKYDIEKISNLKIPLLETSVQIDVCNYMSNNKKIIETNIETINYFEKLKKSIINLIVPDYYIELAKICELYEDSNEDSNKDSNSNEKIIGIYKNGLNSGRVCFMDETTKSYNLYYLSSKNDSVLIKYIYYILDHNQLKLRELSNLTNQTNLAKSSILTFKIPIISISKQTDIISHCGDFKSQILKLNLNNENLNSKDIMGIMSQLQNL
jgi:hypothetical protein